MKKRLLCVLLMLCLLVPTMTACGKPADSSPAGGESASVSENEPMTLPEDTPEEPSVPNPLTGLPLTPGMETKRPVAVMLNDLKAALPQLGVSQADIIYEVPAEGGITRMLALFQDLDGVGDLGSIRSTRTYYLDLALGHDAVLVHAGGSPEAYKKIPAWGVDNLDGVNGGKDAEIFWRDPVRKRNAGYEHSLLTSGEKISEFLASGDIPLERKSGKDTALRFVEDGTPAGGSPAGQATVRFSNYKTGVFVYDADTKEYLVNQYGGPYVDGNTGKQVGVTNVLVLRTQISLISGDSAGRLSVSMTGEGKGSYLCGGQAVDIRWSKPERGAPFTYTLENGTPLLMGVGKTYVCIVSGNSAVEITE